MDYDAVFWDIGGVLLDVDSVREAHTRFMERFVAAHGLDVAPRAALEEWRGVVGRQFRERDGNAYQSAREAYALALAELVGRDLTDDEWFPLFRETSQRYLRPTPHTREVVAALADAGVYQGIVSDVDTEEGEFILSLFGVLDHVDDVTTSEAVGRTKPDDAMFETALAKSPVAPERTLMVGDRYDHDVAGAARHGIRGVAFGANADGPDASHRIDDLRDVLDIVGVRGDR
ncbi:HAD family hydrolase [Salarchaeum japonicum]|uniref:HAD family phosphatase n=1 Tax=Salarchaeum japonicum TaxID=555573 RepID=A0AAV3T1S2_9EURY|nr:HAD family hydrolase [Salarchaeum japonicum]